jgi:iron(III) transport system substrate-binding protein
MHEPEKVLSGFKAKYPFLTVTVFESRGGEILAKLGEEQRAGRFTPDVLILSSEMTTAQEQGFLQEYEFPNVQGWPHQPSNNFYRITDGSPWIVAYNTNAVEEADIPKSYDALLDAKLSKYKFIMSTSGEDTPLYWAAMYGGGTSLNWEQSEQFWSRLVQTHKPDVKPGFTGPLQEVSAGEYDFLPGASQSSTLRLRAQGAPLGIAPMPMAPTNANSALAMAKNAPHPNAAKLYLDYYTTPEGVAAFADAQWYIPFQGGAYEQGVRAVEAAKALGIDFVLTDPKLITTENLKRSSEFWFKTLGVTPS